MHLCAPTTTPPVNLLHTQSTLEAVIRLYKTHPTLPSPLYALRSDLAESNPNAARQTNHDVRISSLQSCRVTKPM